MPQYSPDAAAAAKSLACARILSSSCCMSCASCSAWCALPPYDLARASCACSLSTSACRTRGNEPVCSWAPAAEAMHECVRAIDCRHPDQQVRRYTLEHPHIGAHTSYPCASSENCRTSSSSAWFRWRAACSCRACSASALSDDAMPPVASPVLQSATGLALFLADCTACMSCPLHRAIRMPHIMHDDECTL